ncbi:hypothetical protein J2T57_004007 [Natronocella acetinitrilica]|jgi:hypothetical protein|uniref:Uncharacterized protein n=1 Tax=Natronocella acetinitrilica TaxID=414046 RepID=A0AAE3KDH0_9GAMM|nr:hypothetical protein [Natronocella acetinitrilica]MCP1676834.1 hypothetical protein [Natronocella acetinitrilica]
MNTDPIPDSYEAWRHCITEDCGIPLTVAFVEERLTVWQNSEHEETQRFRRLYGDEHLRTIIAWFRQARQELE